MGRQQGTDGPGTGRDAKGASLVLACAMALADVAIVALLAVALRPDAPASHILAAAPGLLVLLAGTLVVARWEGPAFSTRVWLRLTGAEGAAAAGLLAWAERPLAGLLVLVIVIQELLRQGAAYGGGRSRT